MSTSHRTARQPAATPNKDQRKAWSGFPRAPSTPGPHAGASGAEREPVAVISRPHGVCAATTPGDQPPEVRGGLA